MVRYQPGACRNGPTAWLYDVFTQADRSCTTIRFMRTCITIRANNGEQWRVMPRWRGRSLAVHAPVVGGVCQRQDRRWVITHLATGYQTGGQFYGTLQEAIKAARFWDDHFSQVTAENASRWPLREQWKRIIRKGYAERPWRSMASVAELLGA